MFNLIYNEMIKLVRKKRFAVILLVIVALTPLFTYAQYQEAHSIRQKVGTQDWHTQVQQKIVDMENQLTSVGMASKWQSYLKTEIQLEQYYLNHDINPLTSSGISFVNSFIQESISLLLPLLIMVIASDIVSSEHGEGTIKLLLTRPVKRWRILLSKYTALSLSVAFIILAAMVITYVISGIVFGYGGWSRPVISGFSVSSDHLITSHAYIIPQWRSLIMDAGLAWFVCQVVATLTFMLSVMIRSAAAVMGVMLSLLISGAILANMVSAWNSAKYLFMLNLNLTNYLNGSSPPIQGMTLGFSILNLLIWGLIALLVSFITFTNKDIY